MQAITLDQILGFGRIGSKLLKPLEFNILNKERTSFSHIDVFLQPQAWLVKSNLQPEFLEVLESLVGQC